MTFQSNPTKCVTLFPPGPQFMKSCCCENETLLLAKALEIVIIRERFLTQGKK